MTTTLFEQPGAGPPALTILVCAYNQAAFITDCLASIAACQTPARLELLVLDDGSTDASTAAATAYRYPPGMAVTVLTKPNAGLASSLHLGVARARAGRLLIIAADDWYLPHALDRLLANLPPSRHPPTATVYGAEYADALTGSVYGPATAALLALPPPARLRALSLDYPKPLLLQSTLFDTRLLRNLQPWADGLLLDDWPTFLRIAAAAAEGRAGLDHDPSLTLVAYRVHPGGVHNDIARQLRACLQVVDHVIAPALRARARANVLSDLALVHLAEGRPAQAARLYARALAASPRAAPRLPLATLRGTVRRLRR